ncbi:MAG: FKBP-type peptidyl-prolyl cis-trans isomerase [Piscinibacter sp.]
MAKQNRPFEAKAKGKAENGDRVTISFVGTIDGETFEGGTAEDIQVELGSNSFIPGFEEQLVGVKAGDENDPQGHVPGRTMARRISPARPPSSR